MKLIDLLLKGGAKAADLVKMLEWVVANAPDLAPMAQKILADLELPVTPANLASVLTAAAPELANIAQGKIDSRKHPGDVV